MDANNNAQQSVAQVSIQNVGQMMNRRTGSVGAYSTQKRKTCNIGSIQRTTNVNTRSRCRAELDSHADTCGVNEVAYIIEYMVAEVHGFSKSLPALQDIPIIKAAVAYDDPESGEKTIVILNQALYFGDQLPHILLNQN